ncbi:hypothetical protein Pfo_012352 [Paulownia fortunei]|nr:hypothetical protein Pfo_012352 [Paulownia fortunei]
MRTNVVVFPIRGRNWCFSRSIDPSMLGAQSSNTPSTFKEFCNKIFSSSSSSADDSKVELAVDFVSNKMNGAWSNLEKAPQGTFKNKIHGLGLKLLSRVKPSETFFKSIPKDINRVDIVYPSSLNPRLVRRRLRHIAFRGSVIHKKYFYGSAILLPLTSVFMVLPLPNIPFFWILFRTYSHWRASQGSQKLLHLVSDASCRPRQSVEMAKGGRVRHIILMNAVIIPLLLHGFSNRRRNCKSFCSIKMLTMVSVSVQYRRFARNSI